MGSRAAPVAKRAWWPHHYTFFGTAVGLIFVWLSLTPSLLPRGPLFQGLISGSAGAIGYGLGVFGVWLVRYLRSMERSPAAPRWAWLTLLGVGMVGQLLMITWFHLWQNDVRAKVGVANLGFWAHPQAAVLLIVFLFLIVEIGQLTGKLASHLVRQVDRIAPPRVSAVVVVALLLTFTIALLNGVVVRVAMNVVNNSFESVNDETDPASPAPTTSLRSGGPGSLVSWKSLGNQGRIFMTNGPTVDELSKFNGAKATEPIRVYAGMNSADDIKGAAALAADELVRTRGLERKVVAVVTTTGTGWINEAEASALEYMLNGDTAIVSMQYSFLPSGLSFLVDSEHARQAGQALFEAVDAELKQIPEAKRPRLLVFGESLGSFGGEAPFLAVNNLVARTDGALSRGAVHEHHLERPHDQPRQGLPAVAARVRRRRARPIRIPAGRPRSSRESVGLTPGGVPPARVRSLYLVESRPAAQRARLASRTARPGRLGADVLDSGRDVHAGSGRHGGLGRRARWPRSRIPQRRRERVGGHLAAAEGARRLVRCKDGETAADTARRSRQVS
jgi:uncharacterized membrane protein